jgi:hypothetical protein
VSNWKIIFETEINGRPVKGEVYEEGGFKITTTQKEDFDGSVSGDDGSPVITSPISAGQPIEFNAETLDELKKDLITDSFTDEEATEIIDKF